MAELPPEISKAIAILLHQQDKVECMLVCRKWKEIISTHCLFHTVRVCNAPSLQRLETLFRQHPQQGAQVQYLVLEMKSTGSLDLREFMRLVPNVKYVYSYSWDEVLLDTEPHTQPWHHRIQHISLQANQLLNAHLIFTKKLCQIKRLLLSGIDIFEDEFFDNLRNISTLSHLTLVLCSTKLTLTRMELLDKSLPLLEHLSMDTLSLSYEPLPSCISPAIHLVKLCLGSISSTNVQTKIVWLDYIGRKYPNISHLENEYLYDKLAQEQNDQGLTISVAEGYNALFQRLGSRIKRFDLQSEAIPVDIFDILDNSGCQLHYLKISKLKSHSLYKYIEPSGQAKSIQTLDLTFKSFTRLTWLKDMPVLTTLILDCNMANKGSIEFTKFLDICPDQLESLELRSVILASDMLCSPHSLKSLHLSSSHLFPGFDFCVSACLPQLSVLKFIHCSGLPTRFTLLAHCLSRFEIMNRPNIPFYRLEVTTRKDKKARTYISWYHDTNTHNFDNDTPSLYPSPRCRPQGSSPHLILECYSVEKIVL